MSQGFESHESRQFDLDFLSNWRGVDQIEFRSSVASTNDWALDFARQSNPRENVILFLTDAQTAGRGRYDRKWDSVDGVLTFSLLLAPETPLAAEVRTLLPLSVGCGISDALLTIGMANEIKWPNDIVVSDRKLGGILVESVPGDQRFVIGCGINVNQKPEQWDHAISIRMASGQRQDMTQWVTRLVHHVLGRVTQLGTDPKLVIETLNSRNWLLDKNVKWTSGEHSETGMVSGIAGNGGLIFQTKDGPKTVHSGTIRPLRNSEGGGFDW